MAAGLRALARAAPCLRQAACRGGVAAVAGGEKARHAASHAGTRRLTRSGAGTAGVLPCAASKGSGRERMRTIALVAAVLVSTPALADTTTRYTVLFQDRPGGSQVTTVRADGRIDVDMSYRNNGRGPDIREHSRFAPDGTLVSF